MPDPEDCPYELQMEAFVSGFPRWTKAQTLWHNVEAAFRRGEHRSAVALLTEFLTIPAHPGWRLDGLLNRGRCYLKLGRTTEALADFNAVVESKTVFSELRRRALTFSIEAHLQAGDRAKAIAACEAAIECRDPSFSEELRGRLGNLVSELSEPEAAGKEHDP